MSDPSAPSPYVPDQHAGQGTPHPAPGVPGPARRAGAGPVVMTVVGAVVLVLAIVAGVLGARQALDVLPIGVLSGDGSPGPDVLGGMDVPGEFEIDLAAEQSYALVLARPSDVAATEGDPLDGEITVLSPSGADIRVRAASVDMESALGGVRATSLAGFTTAEAGIYRVTVPPTADGGEAQLLLTEELPFDEFFSGLGGMMAAGVVATLLGLIGLGLLVGGIVWWVLARRPRPQPVHTQHPQHPQGPQPPYAPYGRP